MKKIAVVLAVSALTLTLTACEPSLEEIHKERVAELNNRAELAEQCREAGGRYVLTTPSGYVSSSYWCIWDDENKGDK